MYYFYYIVPSGEFDGNEFDNIISAEEFDGEYHVIDCIGASLTPAAEDCDLLGEDDHSHLVAMFRSVARAQQYQRMLTE